MEPVPDTGADVPTMLNLTQNTVRRLTALLLAVATLSAACAGDTGPLDGPGLSGTTPPTGLTTTTTLPTVDIGDVQLTSGLIPFTACEDLLVYLRAEAAERVGPYGLGGGGFYGGPVVLEAAAMTEPMMMEGPSMAVADGGVASRAMVEGVDYSGTNVQELGIDEPDLIKTDGNRIIVVQDDRLHHIDVSGEQAVLTDTIRLENHWSSDLLLVGDRVLVLAGTEPPYGPVPLDGSENPLSRLVPPGQWRQLTSIIEVDLSDPGNLVVANTLTVEGRYVSARVVNGAARVVITSPMDDLPFVYPAGPAGEERAERVNREVIAETTVDDWVPGFVHEAADGTVTDGRLVDCTDISHPVEFSGFSTLSVLTVDLGAPLGAPRATAVLADGQTVYAGNEHLYVATNRYHDPIEFDEGPWGALDDNYATSIHQFGVSDPTTTGYLASGTVTGHLLNQFSMSEHDGHLRVATTLGRPWGFREDSESLVTVMARDADELVQVGQVGDMGRGERIFAVRFVGEVGYVVTFRQTDPFYTLDLSDPTEPVVRGELKIAGYSGYLHPVGDGLVLGIGQDATDTGRTTGAKATLFDVSDLDAPTALGTWSAGGGSTSVEWDHRAFLWWAPEQLAVLPFTDWRSDTNAAVVLRIADGTIIEVGRIDHTPDDTGGPVVFPCPLIDPAEGADMLPRPPGGMTLMLCTDGGHPQVRDHWCEYMNAEEVRRYGMEFGVTGIEVPEGAMVAACFPDDQGWVPPIERTLVIGDDLWSYSRNRVQANDMATLTRLQVVGLG